MIRAVSIPLALSLGVVLVHPARADQPSAPVASLAASSQDSPRAASPAAEAQATGEAAASVPPRSWAFEFGLSGLSLTSFDGASLSLRRQTSDHSAWRLGLTGSVNTAVQKAEVQSTGNPPSHIDAHGHTSGISVSLTRLTFPSRAGRLSPYLGAGPEAGWVGDRTDQTGRFLAPDGSLAAVTEQVIKGTFYHASLSLLAGCEWQATERIAIHAEYRESAEYDWGRDTNDLAQTAYPSGTRSASSATSRFTGWLVRGRAVSGVSVFF